MMPHWNALKTDGQCHVFQQIHSCKT